VTADYNSLISLDILQDDAFYYLKIAQNIIDGRGMTFDGVAPTNGFQPLFMLFLLPIMIAAGGDLLLPIQGVGILLTVFAVANAVLIFWLTRILADTRTALTAMGLWVFSPYFIVYGINGLETGISVFFALAVLYLYLYWIKGGEEPTTWQAILFGFVCGLAVLARIDLAILLAVIAFDWLLDIARRKTWTGVFQKVAVIGIVSISVWLLWGGLSFTQAGVWLPSSGAASRQIALEFGWANLKPVWSSPPSPFFDTTNVPGAYFADIATKLTSVFFFEHPLLGPLRANIPFGVWPAIDKYIFYKELLRFPLIVTGITFFFLTGLFIVTNLIWRNIEFREQKPPRIGGLVFGYIALIFIGYTFYAPAHWFFSRYMSVPVVVTTIFALATVYQLTLTMRKSALLRKIIIVSAISLVALQAFALWNYASPRLNWSDSPSGGFLRSWQNLENFVDKTRKIGAFQAGIYSYFSGLDIVNLDGKVNPLTKAALREKRIHNFIREYKIEYIIDWEWILVALCARHIESEDDMKFARIARERPPGNVSVFSVVYMPKHGPRTRK
jgi:4-amino-4-deoxy-L-arabinose transferase-like glycosyltransferase